jgi:hypothetical protein
MCPVRTTLFNVGHPDVEAKSVRKCHKTRDVSCRGSELEPTRNHNPQQADGLKKPARMGRPGRKQASSSRGDLWHAFWHAHQAASAAAQQSVPAAWSCTTKD